MKLKIKVKTLMGGCLPKIIQKGDWVDLYCAETTELKAPQAGVLKRNTNERDVTFEVTYIPLGVAMELPKGFEAIVLPRSSTPKNFGIMCANSMGVIDHSFKGNNDEWKFPAVTLRKTTIEKGDRICQFRIQLSQKATFLQKLKWLFSSGIELIEVKELSNNDRDGLGSSGTK